MVKNIGGESVSQGTGDDTSNARSDNEDVAQESDCAQESVDNEECGVEEKGSASANDTKGKNRSSKRKNRRISFGESGACADMSSTVDDDDCTDNSVIVENCSLSDTVDDAIAMLSCIGAAVTLQPHDSFRTFANSFKPSLPSHMTSNDEGAHIVSAPSQNTRIDVKLLRGKIEDLHSFIHDIFCVVSRPEFDNSQIARDDAFKDLSDTVKHDHQPPAPCRPNRRNSKRHRQY